LLRRTDLENVLRQLKEAFHTALLRVQQLRIEYPDIADETLLVISLHHFFVDTLKKRKQNDQEFSLLFKVLYDNFDHFVDQNQSLTSIDDKGKEVLKKAFALFKKNDNQA